MQDLAGRTAIVTGSSRGIGRAIAVALAKRGATLAIHCRDNLTAAQQAVDEISALGGRAVVIQADLGKRDGVENLFAAFDASPLGSKLDILVNNAAVNSDVAFEVVRDQDYDRVMDLNLRAPFFAAQQAAERMKDWGRIINIGALSGHRAFGNYPVYSMAKAALNSMTSALAQKLGPRGITVNTISPGPVETDMAAFITQDARAVERYSKMTPLRRLGRPDDIADIAAFLASDEARWITGEAICAGGGLGLS